MPLHPEERPRVCCAIAGLIYVSLRTTQGPRGAPSLVGCTQSFDCDNGFQTNTYVDDPTLASSGTPVQREVGRFSYGADVDGFRLRYGMAKGSAQSQRRMDASHTSFSIVKYIHMSGLVGRCQSSLRRQAFSFSRRTTRALEEAYVHGLRFALRSFRQRTRTAQQIRRGASSWTSRTSPRAARGPGGTPFWASAWAGRRISLCVPSSSGPRAFHCCSRSLLDIAEKLYRPSVPLTSLGPQTSWRTLSAVCLSRDQVVAFGGLARCIAPENPSDKYRLVA